MISNNNKVVPIEAQKPFETVYELKNEVPSFEEFMKSYENDGNVNYADLRGGGIGEVKGYGPCKNSLCGCPCFSRECKCENAEISLHKESNFTAGSYSFSGRKEGSTKASLKPDF